MRTKYATSKGPKKVKTRPAYLAQPSADQPQAMSAKVPVQKEGGDPMQRVKQLSQHLCAVPVLSAARRFEGQVCIVTGGAQGIGRAIATALAKEGARAVWIFDKLDGTAVATALAQEIPGIKAHALQLDLAEGTSSRLKRHPKDLPPSMAPPLTWRPVHSLRVEAAKRRSRSAVAVGAGGEELRLPEEVWSGTVEDLEEWFVKSHGFSGSLCLGVDGFALLPGEPLAALLREKDEVLVSSTTTSLPAPGSCANGETRKPKAKRPKAIADAPGPPSAAKTAPTAPTVERALAPSARVAPSAPKEGRGELEALVKEQARRIHELEEQNALLRRKLEAMAAPQHAAPPTNAANAATPARWTPSTVEQLKKGNVICYQLDLIDAWKGTMQRSEAKVAVITKVSRNAEGSKCFALRCERGGVDFVEAAQLRNVQLRGCR
eukprot:s799_g10.t1